MMNKKILNSDGQSELKINYLNSYDEELPSILLIHGWGSSSGIWANSTEKLALSFNLLTVDLPGHGEHVELSFNSIDEFVSELEACIPVKNFSIIGWSLGGIVGSLLAQRLTERVTALVTIATNQSFLANPKSPSGMERLDFSAFSDALSSASLQNQITRFQVMQAQGIETAKHDCRCIRSLIDGVEFSIDGLELGLSVLENFDLYDCWQILSIPVMHQFGQYDSLVPASSCRSIAENHKHHEYQIFFDSAHLPFISESEKWQLDTSQFLLRALQNQIISKELIADSFSSAAEGYDELAKFQHETGLKLLELLPDKEIDRLVDLGSGTGFHSGSLRDNYPAAQIFELDLSGAMLAYSKRFQAAESPEKKLPIKALQVQGDIENLPIQKSSVDLIFSNLSVQWCDDVDEFFNECARTLVIGGKAFFSTLIQGTLFELKYAWSMVDRGVHVNRFESLSKLQQSCELAGLALDNCHEVDQVQYFDDLRDLLESVKKIGAHNMNSQRAQGFLGKNKYKRFSEAYQSFKTNKNQYPLTYRVVYLELTKRP
ncbi:MAG: malonyl-[acyl-carrier protein] O-methyltransferase BioC [Cellvibrionales bacterium]|nr:malonyl-[acyl-carrier protein] O-methyltransferase BioC [Cellvibrionales bacterium]|tara:strand:+ start:9254 stop:10888 length:1635 start_codon:yes stop_codon:yes gene_type:complete